MDSIDERVARLRDALPAMDNVGLRDEVEWLLDELDRLREPGFAVSDPDDIKPCCETTSAIVLRTRTDVHCPICGLLWRYRAVGASTDVL